MRNYILLAVSVVAGILAFVLMNASIEEHRRKLNLAAEKVKVLSPKRDMLAGDLITLEDLALKTVFKSSATPQQIRKEDSKLVIGQRLASDVNRADFLMWRDIDMPDLERGGGLARRIRDKERALSIAVDSVNSVSGLVRPNDHVDILGTFRFPGGSGQDPTLDTVTLTVLQNVTVLAVGQRLAGSGGDGRRSGYSTVTVAVTPQEAELLVFAAQKGEITLTLRRPNDVYVDTTPQNVNFQFLKDQLQQFTEKRAKRTGALGTSN
jgi:pilus assembly protein CpaB